MGTQARAKHRDKGDGDDDGNATAGDGCSDVCQVEAGWVCLNPGKPCTKASVCGDGVVDPKKGEACDDDACAT